MKPIQINNNEEIEKLNRQDIWIAALLFLAALVWRIPYLIADGLPLYDGLASAATTFQILDQGRIPVHPLGQNYFAPIENIFCALLFPGAPSIFSLRMPCIIFYALSIFVFYLCLRKAFAKFISFEVCLLLAFANSANTELSAGVATYYGAGIFFVSLILAFTIRLHGNRNTKSWFFFGLLNGLAYYAFPLSVIQAIVSSVWLWWGAITIRNLKNLKRYSVKFLKSIVAGSFLLAPVLYRYLSRPDSYAPKMVEICFVAVAIPVMVGGLAVYLKSLKFSKKQYVHALIFLGTFTTVASLPALYFNFFEKSAYDAFGVVLWNAARYSLKNYFVWPFQIKLFLEGTFPVLLLGDTQRFFVPRVMAIKLGWKWIFSVMIFFPAVVWMVWRLLRWLRDKREGYEPLFYGPFLLAVILLLPSWRLHNYLGYRYLLPYVPGFFAAFLVVVNRFLIKRKALLGGLILFYIIYCGFDISKNALRTQMAEKTKKLVMELKSAHVDSVISERELALEIQWISRSSFNLLDASEPQCNFFYDTTRFFSSAKKIARVHVNDKRWRELMGAHIRQFGKSGEFPDRTEIYSKL